MPDVKHAGTNNRALSSEAIGELLGAISVTRSQEARILFPREANEASAKLEGARNVLPPPVIGTTNTDSSLI